MLATLHVWIFLLWCQSNCRHLFGSLVGPKQKCTWGDGSLPLICMITETETKWRAVRLVFTDNGKCKVNSLLFKVSFLPICKCPSFLITHVPLWRLSVARRTGCDFHTLPECKSALSYLKDPPILPFTQNDSHNIFKWTKHRWKNNKYHRHQPSEISRRSTTVKVEVLVVELSTFRFFRQPPPHRFITFAFYSFSLKSNLKNLMPFYDVKTWLQ